MIRNLKILTLAAMLLSAFGALSAAGAQAAEFHCSVEPCTYTLKPDGTGKTAHHVFLVTNSTGASINITCESLAGEATTAGKTAAELTFKNLKYEKCKDPFGNTVIFDINECDYGLTAAGTIAIKCPAGKKIEATFSSGCIVTIGPQGPLNGIAYHNTVVGGVGQITAEINVAKIAASLDGTTAECGIDPSKTPITVDYTTGNTLFPGETDPVGETEVESWWQ